MGGRRGFGNNGFACSVQRIFYREERSTPKPSGGFRKQSGSIELKITEFSGISGEVLRRNYLIPSDYTDASSGR